MSFKIVIERNYYYYNSKMRSLYLLQETNNNCVILYPADDMINDDIPHESLMSAYNPRDGSLGRGGDEQQPVPRAPRHDRHPAPRTPEAG